MGEALADGRGEAVTLSGDRTGTDCENDALPVRPTTAGTAARAMPAAYSWMGFMAVPPGVSGPVGGMT